MRIDNYGPDACLVRFADRVDDEAFQRSQALWRRLDEHPPVGLLEATPGFTTLLLEFEPGTRPEAASISGLLEPALRPARKPSPPPHAIEIPVIYDGPDLERVAAAAQLSVADAITLHTQGQYRVLGLGFAPGFAYLGGLDPRLHTPRIETPRVKVPAGSVAIGGPFTAVYPCATAGGWNLIGRTELPILDPVRAAAGVAAAFRLHPGDAVRFVPVASQAPTPS
ncbi:MAG: 5-oxoprolinase subunit PxpB [Verrucomicrobiae bacterium]|nr:5-oxoprolinase subunit PxpB [Verrucomicrobiae bacterium]